MTVRQKLYRTAGTILSVSLTSERGGPWHAVYSYNSLQTRRMHSFAPEMTPKIKPDVQSTLS